jgi:death-on-curing protein
MLYLILRELVHVGERAIGAKPVVRDHGLLASALARPRATVFGQDAYPSLDLKAAALLHSLARNHALGDGNERLALAAVLAFYGMNGRRITLSNEEAYEFVMNIAEGKLETVEEIASVLADATTSRR